MSEKNQYIQNLSYIFIPFCIEDPAKFPAFNDDIAKSGKWSPVKDEIRYLHRYVSSRLTEPVDGKLNAFHYRLKSEFAKDCGIFLEDRTYRTSPKKYKGTENVTFDFTISDVQLFCFNTSICVVAIRLRFADGDPFMIAAAQYYLRKLSTEPIHVIADDGTEHSQSFIELSKALLSDYANKYSTDFFFYAAPQNERANFFTYIDVPKKTDYSEELFYLKWCYHDGFVYDTSYAEDDDIDYVASSNTVWGISTSAAVCLVNRTPERHEFIEKTFQKNFQNQYLFTYILLLHQKYMMYLFLTKMSVGIDNDLELLENYKQRLYEFETHYMFSYISEVPQYQRFYDKVKKAFALNEMFHDVQEPLSRLAEIQRQMDDENQRKYDNKINTALTTLSLLTIVSALTDASGITSNLDWLISPIVSKIIQIGMLGLVIATSIFMIVRLISLKNKR